eukprot:scaffold137592_cov130-Phaeocystis_antarctica.AAC.2
MARSVTASTRPRRRLRSPSSRAPICSSGWSPTAYCIASVPPQKRYQLHRLLAGALRRSRPCRRRTTPRGCSSTP